MANEIAKKAAALKAATYVSPGMTVGLGTGSTAFFVVEALGELVRQGLDIRGVPTSIQTERLALQNGIPLISSFVSIDLTIDGADEVDGLGNLIKGGGGALAREKIVAAASRQVVIVVDDSKLVPHLGRHPLAVEALEFGSEALLRRLASLGCKAVLRNTNGMPAITDNGNHIIDCDFGRIEEPTEVSALLSSFPGVVEHGLFIGLTTTLVIGFSDGRTEVRQFG